MVFKIMENYVPFLASIEEQTHRFSKTIQGAIRNIGVVESRDHHIHYFVAFMMFYPLINL